MLKRGIVALVIAVFLALILPLLGTIIISLKVDPAVVVGKWLETYSVALGILAGLYYFFAPELPWHRHGQP